MGKLKSLISSMMKVGLIGFGGGNALIPVIEQEAVKEKELISKEEYDKDVIAATLTPGALPVEIASGVGLQTYGIRGMLTAGVAMALPGAVLTIVLLSVLGQVNETVLTQIQYASIGITAFIMCLLTDYIVSTVKTYRNSRFRILLWCIIVGVFLATGSRTILAICHIEGITVPKFSTIQILLLTLLISIIIGIFRKKGERKKRERHEILWQSLVLRVSMWILFFILLSIPAFVLIGKEVAIFDLRGLASSVISFGGGDAYLTIADSLFVPEFISESEFYNHLVLIVNVLPGSILCKTLAGIGYVYGASLTGTSIGGILMAVAGFSCSVAASCTVFYIIYHIYDWLERVDVFVVIRKTIRVVVSGLLMTVMASLIKSGIDMNANPALPHFTVLAMIAIIYVINLFLFYKGKCKNLIRIFISLSMSLIACNLLKI